MTDTVENEDLGLIKNLEFVVRELNTREHGYRLNNDTVMANNYQRYRLRVQSAREILSAQAATIAKLQAERLMLREALDEFITLGDAQASLSRNCGDPNAECPMQGMERDDDLLGVLRRARAALSPKEDDK